MRHAIVMLNRISEVEEKKLAIITKKRLTWYLTWLNTHMYIRDVYYSRWPMMDHVNRWKCKEQ
jgi:hypothetical protein